MTRFGRGLLLSSAIAWLAPTPCATQLGTVRAEQKISQTEGGFGGLLETEDRFGAAVARLGDVDGDGTGDLAVGAPGDDDGGIDHGAVWILFLDSDGTVTSEQKISSTAGGFGGTLSELDLFGWSLAGPGDLNGDGTPDLAVGAPGDGDNEEGCVWLLFLNPNGSVAGHVKIDAGTSGFAGSLSALDQFGVSVAALGDLDGNGTADLAVGANLDDDGGPGGTGEGAVWILFLGAGGQLVGHQKISATQGGFQGAPPLGEFGYSVACLGDLDGDGIVDLAVGAPGDPVGPGAVWILFLAPDGTVVSQQKISEGLGGLAGMLDLGDGFGLSVGAPGDLNLDGTPDLVLGLYGDELRGTLWVLFLTPGGTVASQHKLGMTQGGEPLGGFGGTLDLGDWFGASVAGLGDLDGDGANDLVAGAIQDDDGGVGHGAVWVLFLEGDSTPPTLSCPPLLRVLEPKGGPPGQIVSYSVSAHDDLDPAPSLVCFPPSGSFFPRGTTMVTCIATDASGNQSLCTFPVIVRPTIQDHRL